MHCITILRTIRFSTPFCLVLLHIAKLDCDSFVGCLFLFFYRQILSIHKSKQRKQDLDNNLDLGLNLTTIGVFFGNLSGEPNGTILLSLFHQISLFIYTKYGTEIYQ